MLALVTIVQRLGGVLAVSACVVVLGGCGRDREASADAGELDRILTVGYAQEPPYAYIDSTGRVGGESPVALRGALASLGSGDSVRWVRMPFDELLPSLQEGGIDVVASGLYPTPERRTMALFTRSTSCSGPALAVRAEASTPVSIATFVSDRDARLAVLRGAVEERAARELGIPDDRIVRVADLVMGLDVVREGRADGFALTEPTLRYALRDHEGLRVETYEPPGSVAGLVAGCSALAVRLDAEDLALALDRGLGDFIGSEEHRALVEIFGFSIPDLVMRTGVGRGEPR